MKKLLIPILLLIAISSNNLAQGKASKNASGVPELVKSSRELKGDKYAFKYAFDDAIISYKGVKNLSIEGQRKLADSYHKLGRNEEAEVAYSKLVSNQESALPEDHYNYSMILKANGKYQESLIWMDKFSAKQEHDLRAKSYIASKASLGSLIKDNGKYKIDHLSVNTDDQDFGTSFYKDQIVFASSRAKAKAIKREYNWNRKPFLDLYISKVENSQLKAPVRFDKGINGKMHDGPASFSNEGTYMAFSKNDRKDKTKDKVVELQICFSSYEKGKWSKAKSFVLNSPDYSVGHPFLTADGNTMYFTSDMPGGCGGADIYRIKRDEKGEWLKAENLGDKINTEGDEMFPFVQESTGNLYFTSNGRFGLGGLDIFKCQINKTGFTEVQNAGAPLNSQYDDFALVVDKTNKGYFSSNRIGGKGDDDIYSVNMLEKIESIKKIEGIALDKNGLAIPSTYVVLMDVKGIAIDSLTTPENGSYSFSVASDRAYKLMGRKNKYSDGKNEANTFGKELIVKADLLLLSNEEMVQKVELDPSLKKIIGLKSIYFDLDKYNIRPDAAIELNKIVKIMNENPFMVVELGSHTDCRHTVAYNQTLSDKRARASADYIKERITKPERIYGKGYGKSKLSNECACEGDVISTCSEEEHQKNRHTEFTVVKK